MCILENVIQEYFKFLPSTLAESVVPKKKTSQTENLSGDLLYATNRNLKIANYR